MIYHTQGSDASPEDPGVGRRGETGAATPDSVISVRGLEKRFGDLVAVAGVEFDVFRGETFGFLGPNGAGKTTTINMLCTLAMPTAGSATVAGFDVVHQRDDVRRSIGLVFQDTTLDSYLTAERNLRFHAELYGVPREQVDPRMREVMDIVGLWDRKDSKVMEYSGGMMRRLEIARGLLHYPRVLFLDEPTIGLDPQTRSHIWTYISELKKREDITIFLTTHYMDEAENCDRIAIIDQGQIVALDTPEALKASIGKDRVQIRTPDDEAAIAAMRERFGIEASVHEGEVTFSVESGRAVRPPALRRARAADRGRPRVAADARRRLHVVHRQDDPRRRGREPAPGDGEALAREAIAMAVETTQPRVAAAPIRLGSRTFAHEVRGAKIVFAREMIRFWQDRSRAVVSLLQPVLFLFVLGTGLSSLVSARTGGISFRTFMFPGVIAMSTIFTAMFSAASLVWDREFGFLREMLVAPGEPLLDHDRQGDRRRDGGHDPRRR